MNLELGNDGLTDEERDAYAKTYETALRPLTAEDRAAMRAWRLARETREPFISGRKLPRS